jgi:hypothetical protein
MGFDSVSDCVASLHAAQNLGIPFDSLKGKVTSGRKLSAAIHDLKPGVDATAEARRGGGAGGGGHALAAGLRLEH